MSKFEEKLDNLLGEVNYGAIRRFRAGQRAARAAQVAKTAKPIQSEPSPILKAQSLPEPFNRNLALPRVTHFYDSFKRSLSSQRSFGSDMAMPAALLGEIDQYINETVNMATKLNDYIKSSGTFSVQGNTVTFFDRLIESLKVVKDACKYIPKDDSYTLDPDFAYYKKVGIGEDISNVVQPLSNSVVSLYKYAEKIRMPNYIIRMLESISDVTSDYLQKFINAYNTQMLKSNPQHMPVMLKSYEESEKELEPLMKPGVIPRD